MRLLVLGFLAFVLSACLYNPRDVTISPEIRGVIKRLDSPVANINVSMSTANHCSQQGQHRSDAQGRFVIPAVKQRIDWVGFGDPVYAWTFCLELEGSWQVGLTGFEIGYVETPRHLSCKLTGQASSVVLCQ